MKKIFSLFLVLVTLLSLSACGTNVAQRTDAESSPSQTSNDNTANSTTSGDDQKVTTDEPSDCEHDYTTATCTVPKICTKCEYIAGHSLPHNYQNGICTVCGRSEMAFNIKQGDWIASTVKNDTNDKGEILLLYALTKNQYVNAVCYSNASSCIVNLGKVIYNGKTYYVDYYYLALSAVDWEENGDTVTIISFAEEATPLIVLTQTSETQLTVNSANEKANIPVGTVFVEQ